MARRQHDDNENDSIGDDNLSNKSDGVENSAQKEKGEGSEVTGEDKTIRANEDKTPDDSTGGDSTDVRKSGDSAEETGKTVEEVEDETNKAMENPETQDDSTDNISQMSAVDDEGWVYQSQPGFSKNYEVYK